MTGVPSLTDTTRYLIA